MTRPSHYRRLADANPDTYLPDVAMTLNNLGILYRDRHDVAAAQAAYDEALHIYRRLAGRQPGHLPAGCRHDAQQPGLCCPATATTSPPPRPPMTRPSRFTAARPGQPGNRVPARSRRDGCELEYLLSEEPA